jgi:hypothetical protein
MVISTSKIANFLVLTLNWPEAQKTALKKGKQCCLAHKVLISSIIFLWAFINKMSVILHTKICFSKAYGKGNTGRFQKTVFGKK